MTTIAALAVLSPAILIALVVVAGLLAVRIALFIGRALFWLAIGGVIGLALWAGETRAECSSAKCANRAIHGIIIPEY